MTQDGPLHWRRRFQVSAQDLADLRRGWTDVGRQVWESGTRAGRDIKARTELELEALGRAHERQVEQAQRAGDRVKEAVGEGLRRGERAVRQFTAVAVPAVTSAARAQTRMAQVQEAQRVRAADTGARLVTMPPHRSCGKAPWAIQGPVVSTRSFARATGRNAAYSGRNPRSQENLPWRRVCKSTFRTRLGSGNGGTEAWTCSSTQGGGFRRERVH